MNQDQQKNDAAQLIALPAKIRLIHWLLAAAMILGLVGGSCSMQDVLPGSISIPTKAAYKKNIEALNLPASANLSEAQTDAVVDASLAFIKAQKEVRDRFRRPLAVASALMVFAYMALFLLAHKVWRSGQYWAEMLSKVALAALPVRAALAGIEYSIFSKLKIPLMNLCSDLAMNGAAGTDTSAGESALRAAGTMYGKIAVALGNGLFWGKTMAVAAVLYAVYVVFARPEIQQLLRPADGEKVFGKDRDNSDDPPENSD